MVLQGRDRDRESADVYVDGCGGQDVEVDGMGNDHVDLARDVLGVKEGQDLHVLGADPIVADRGVGEVRGVDRHPG